MGLLQLEIKLVGADTRKARLQVAAIALAIVQWQVLGGAWGGAGAGHSLTPRRPGGNAQQIIKRAFVVPGARQKSASSS